VEVEDKKDDIEDWDHKEHQEEASLLLLADWEGNVPVAVVVDFVVGWEHTCFLSIRSKVPPSTFSSLLLNLRSE